MRQRQFNKQEILNGIISLDTAVYQYLDAKYYKDVIRHVCYNSGSKEDGEEHYQDVIFELYLKIEQNKVHIDQSVKFEQYFWMLVKRRWIDVLRKRKNAMKTTGLDELVSEIGDHKEELVDQELSHRLVIALNKSISSLSKEEIEYVEMYYFAKKSLKAIAEYFGTSYEYTKLKLHRIRNKLRKIIHNDPEFKLLITQ